jgi:hypothetical protein
MAGLDTLTITNSGFFNINKKIINRRTFVGSLINIVGSPIILDGVASGFSEESYLTYSPLTFTDSEKITINFKGTFLTGTNKQTAWELINSFNSPITLSFENSRVILTYGRYTILSLGNLNLTDNTEISTFINLKETSYEFTINTGTQVIQRSGDLNFTIPLTSFTILNIGSSSLNREEAWMGSAYLTDFFIYNNGTFLYSPSEGTSWNFSNILVSDGALVLSDSTQPTAGHIYSFPVTEISRSGSTVLLTCKIDEDAYLTIREIGLYIQTPNGKAFFGSISNLNVNKTRDLAYDLVFTVNTTINVVNAIGFPAENGIVVEDPDYIEFKNFTTLQQVNTYVLTNLERIIRMNAGAKGSYINSSIENAQAGIGYNRPQVIYRLQQELESQEDCYNSIDTFIKLTNKFQEVIENQIDKEKFTVHGDLNVPINGVVDNFSATNYVNMETPFSSTASWELTTGFSAAENTSGTIVSLGNASSQVPLELGVQNNKCYLKIRSLESINPTPLNSYYIKDAAYDTEEEGTNYYAWTRVDQENKYYNFHCSGLLAASSSLINFPQASALKIEHEDINSSNFTFSIRVLFTDVTNTHYIIGKESSSSIGSFELYVENEKLKVNLYKEITGEPIVKGLSTRYNLKTNRYYNITLSYNGERYSLHYEMEPTEGEYPESETEFIYSTEAISLESTEALSLGARYVVDSESPFEGVIDFYRLSLFDNETSWVGCSELSRILTTTETPSSSSALYDSTLYLIENIYAGSYEHGNVVDESNLFNVGSDKSYKVTISYTENENSPKGIYEVKVTTKDEVSTVLSKEVNLEANLSNRMNIPTATFIGVTSQALNPFSATINLLDCKIRNGEEEWTLGKEVVVNGTELIQYYRMPDLNKNQYAVKDLCNLERKIRFLSDRFEGNEDIIDFTYSRGFTLCTKVDLKDAEPKVLLYKSDLVNDVYFSLTFLNQTLAFTIATYDGSTTISKHLEIEEYASYTNEPIMVTIVVTPQYNDYYYIQMYKNNKAITEPTYVRLNKIANPRMFILSNYLTSVEDIGRYVTDIVAIKGAISENDLKYINNLFDTNY